MEDCQACCRPLDVTWIEAVGERRWSLQQVPHMLTVEADMHEWIRLQYQSEKQTVLGRWGGAHAYVLHGQ